MKILLVHVRLILFPFFLGASNIWYFFLYLVAFHTQIFLMDLISYVEWYFSWYFPFVPSVNWDLASQMEIMKQCIPEKSLFQQMTMLQYWVYWLILILIQCNHTWHGYIFNIAKLYPFFLLSCLNWDVFSALHDKHLSMEM